MIINLEKIFREFATSVLELRLFLRSPSQGNPNPFQRVLLIGYLHLRYSRCNLPQGFLINKYLQFIYSNFSDMTERVVGEKHSV